MSWTDASLKDYAKLGKIPGDLLYYALKKFKEATRQKIEIILEDKNGVFGFNMERVVLTAKSYIYLGNVVSCHKRAIYSAINTKKKLVMFIGSNKTFYSFNPEDVLKITKENIRARSTFLNFSIRIGTKLFSIIDDHIIWHIMR